MRNRTFVDSKSTFIVSLIVIILTVLSVWLLGLGKHHTMIENSLLSTAILSSAFFLFIAIGLYGGYKLKDNLGRITDKFDWKKIEHLKSLDSPNSDMPDVGDGIVGIIFGVILWLIISFVISFLLWVFGAILWIIVLLFIGMLYWIFFRALRLVFKKSSDCRGQFDRSVMFAFFYTILYSSWVFGIIYIASRN